MRHWLCCLVVIFFFYGPFQGLSQQGSAFELGAWRTYLPSGEYTQIVYGTESVIIVNPFQLIVYYPETEEQLTLAKGKGLSDVGISSVAYFQSEGSIVVGYENGNIDIVGTQQTINLPGIKNNQNILGSKRINDVVVAEGDIFLATDFGVVQINASIYEFGSTLFTDEPIRHIEWMMETQTLVGASETELYFVEFVPGINLSDINQWNILPPDQPGPIQDMAVWQGELHLVIGDLLWKWKDEILVEVVVSVARIRFIKPSESHLVVINEFSNIITWDGQQSIQYRAMCLLPIVDILMIDPTTFWYIEKEEFGWFADEVCDQVFLPGVPSRYVTEMTVMEGGLFVATGGVTRIYNNLFREDGFYTNDSGEWVRYSNQTVPVLGERNMRDIYQVEAIPHRNQVYFGTFWGGVVRYEDGELKIFDNTNSSLMFSVTNPDRIRVADLFLDHADRLWVANHDASRPLSVMTPDEEWRNFPIAVNPRIEKLVVDEFENIWMAIAERGIFILNLNDWDVDGDDVSRLIIPTPDDGSGVRFDNARINEIALDLNGGVWVGTESGPVLFDCGNIVFQELCQGRKPVIDLDGRLGVLLRNENIRAIAIDGGNRKWFGTDNGVYVVNAAVDRIDHHFHVNNSPLPDNSITDIAIDHASGEVYIATLQGLVSYRGEATRSEPVSHTPLAIFPNPVPPEYSGMIGIKDLPENALVRITTMAGRLIYENRALGGQLVWNRQDQDGRQVASGVYLVFATQDRSLEPFTQVGKIFILD